LTLKYEKVQSKIIKVEILKGGQAYVQRKELKTMIDIKVKVFHGKRENHVFKVSILDKI
jgi:hypothetical protein